MPIVRPALSVGFASLTLCYAPVFAVDRVQGADGSLNCSEISAQQLDMKKLIDAGSTDRTLGQAAAGGAANVGGQIATSQVAGGLFGAFGGLAAKVAGSLTQSKVESTLGATPEQQETAKKAASRNDFLTQLANAKNCANPDQERKLSLEEFQQVAMAAPIGVIKAVPMSTSSITGALNEPVQILGTTGVMDGTLKLKGKKVYLAEYRVLFDVGGESSASTRAGYALGYDYGSTKVKVKYKIPAVDVAAFQAITDKAFEDFKARMIASGLDIEFSNPPDGGVYDATELASTPEKPVYSNVNLGTSKRVYLVMAPTGMKVVSRGFAGIGAGNIGKRLAWSKSNTEGMSVTQSINIAEHESSGTGSSIWKRGSSADVKSGLIAGNSPNEFVVQTHVGGGLLRIANVVPVEGQFANFKDVGGYDSTKDTTMRVLGALQNAAGQGASSFKTVEKEVELDGPAMARMSLSGLATLNQAIVLSVQ